MTAHAVAPGHPVQFPEVVHPERAEPVGGKLLTPGYLVLLALAGLGAATMLYRFVVGLGVSTAMNDGYPWGLWIAFDVVTGTALGAGGYSMALLIYVLNRGQYHSMVRPAVVTTALGYTMAALSIVVDLGRYWNMWRLPVSFGSWNFNSALLEVALCVMAYTIVAWLETGDAVLEYWSRLRSYPRVAALSQRAHRILRRVLPFVIAAGVLLPTMHQSSLGTIFVLSTKLHPLWHTPMLPLLFLVSCLAMGFGGVVLESSLSSVAFKRPGEADLLARVSRIMSLVVFGYLALRLGDVLWRGVLWQASAGYQALFALECALFAAPALLLLSEKERRDPGVDFAAATMLVGGGTLYRFNVYLVAFNPGDNWSYFPSVAEILISVGLVAMELAIYVFIVRKFPILSGRSTQSVPARTS